MNLNVHERLLLISVLPKDNLSITTMRVVNELTNALGFTEKELKRYKIQDVLDEKTKKPTGKIQWNKKGSTEDVDIKIGERAKEVIIRALRNLSESKQLSMQYWTLIDKFNVNDFEDEPKDKPEGESEKSDEESNK